MSVDAGCWCPAYVGLGSNLDEPIEQVRSAFRALAELPETTLQRRSALWRSAPMGLKDQPDYINAAAGLLTRLDPLSLLAQLQGIEQRQGRRRDGERWGARTLDLDLLAFADEQLESETLQLPHPGVAQRAFVLAPLAQVAPALRLPGVGPVRALAEAVDMSEVTLVGER